MYQMMNGVSQATFFILPMLEKHPDEYPRFRDCFTSDEEHPDFDDYIHVYTRTGGNNRSDYELENNAMKKMPEYVIDWDDSFDNTYASWIFKVPEKWKSDFNLIKEGRLKEVSLEYQKQLKKVYPKLVEKFDRLFSNSDK